MLTAVGEATGFRFSMEKDGYWMKTDDFADKPLEAEELVARVGKLIDAAAKEDQET
jgi:DNA-binding response OmpR family regulator